MRAGALMLMAAMMAMPGMWVQGPVERRAAEEVTTLRVKTRLVNVAVNVADVRGGPVGGLDKEDFEVREDGKTQKIAFFDRQSTSPLSIVMAIDGSESVLRNERLEREAAKRFVKALLREQDEMGLIEFADTVREIVPFTNKAKSIDAGLGRLEHGDATALYDAIYLGAQRLGETKAGDGRRRVLMLITDGQDTAKTTRYAQALEQAQRAGAMVYSIIIVPVAADAGRNTGGEHALIQMAQDTGGKYYYVEDPRDLDAAFQHVSDDLRTQYVLGYYAPRRAAEDSFRAIQVTLVDPKRAGLELRYRTGYYADPQ